MRIREVIEEQGMTTKEVADKLGISLSALNQNISGNPSVKVLTRISEVLDVPIWQLFVSPSELKGENELIALIEHGGDFYKAATIVELETIVSILKEKSK